MPSVGARGVGGGGVSTFSGTTHFGFTFDGKSLCLNVESISTHFFIYHLDCQGKYDENYSGHIF